MIVSLLQIDSLVRFHRNGENLRLFVDRDLFYCHYYYLFQGHIIITPILKPHQEPPLPIDSLDHTSKLLPQPPVKSFPNLILQLT